MFPWQFMTDAVFLTLGDIHKQRRQFGGGEGGQIDDMGQYERGRCQRKYDIINSRLVDYNFF
jgi:hypothetical protein